jgi:hypothetical protein
MTGQIISVYIRLLGRPSMMPERIEEMNEKTGSR